MRGSKRHRRAKQRLAEHNKATCGDASCPQVDRPYATKSKSKVSRLLGLLDKLSLGGNR